MHPLMAALMAGGTARTRVDLVAASPYAIPGGVTSVTFYASGTPGSAGPASGPNGGGGGAPGWLHRVTLAVTPGEVLTVTPLGGVGGIRVTSDLQGTLFDVQNGATSSSATGGAGGQAVWGPTAQTSNGGVAGTAGGTTGGNGGNATALSIGGGTVCGGGGGGGGGTSGGGTGGTSGPYTAGAPVNPWGAAGAGFLNGSQRLSGSTTSVIVAGFAALEY